MEIKHTKRTMLRLFRASILLCLIAMAGCMAEEETSVNNEDFTKNLSPEMKLIKDKFDLRYNTAQTRTTMQELSLMFTDLEPEWNNAMEEENENEKIILVPIRVKAIQLLLNHECSQTYDETGDERYLTTRTLLCFKKNKKTEKEDFFFMSFVPTRRYLEKNNFDIKNNFYLKRDADYDGKVVYHDIHSRFVNGWEYQNGKIVAYETPKSNTDNGAATRSSSISMVCYELCTVTVYEFCFTVNGGPPQHGYYSIDLKRDEFCVYSIHNGNQSAAWWIDNENDKNGGGGGGYEPPTPPLNNKIKTLFKGDNNLNVEDTKKLNDTFQEMLSKCFYETINNYLLLRDVQLRDIKMNPSYGGQAGINNMGDLTFRDSEQISAENLSHEWIHLFQRAYNNMGTAPFGDKQGMMEFEVALVQDIIKLIDYKGDWDIIAHSWACSNMNNNVYRNKYQDWLDKITIKGTIILPKNWTTS